MSNTKDDETMSKTTKQVVQIIGILLLGCVAFFAYSTYFAPAAEAAEDALTLAPIVIDAPLPIVDSTPVPVVETIAADITEPSLVRICEITIEGDSSWHFDILVAAAKKYGCTVSIDPGNLGVVPVES